MIFKWRILFYITKNGNFEFELIIFGNLIKELYYTIHARYDEIGLKYYNFILIVIIHYPAAIIKITPDILTNLKCKKATLTFENVKHFSLLWIFKVHIFKSSVIQYSTI